MCEYCDEVNAFELRDSVIRMSKRVDDDWNAAQSPTKHLLGYETNHHNIPDALTCALACFYRHFEEPEKAVLAAANFGGSTSAIGALVGEMVGAKHGDAWITPTWQFGLSSIILQFVNEIVAANATKSLQRLAYHAVIATSRDVERCYGPVVARFVKSFEAFE